MITQHQKFRVCLCHKGIMPFAFVVYQLITNWTQRASLDMSSYTTRAHGLIVIYIYIYIYIYCIYIFIYIYNFNIKKNNLKTLFSTFRGINPLSRNTSLQEIMGFHRQTLITYAEFNNEYKITEVRYSYK